MKNVLLIKGLSQYDAMRQYIDEIEIGFRLAGYNTIVLDALDISYEFQLNELVNIIKIDFIFTCNAIMTNLISEIPDAIYVTYLCDHPAAHRERLKCMDEKAVVFTCDAFHARYIEKYYLNIKNVMFVPLSGSYIQKEVPYEERKRDVVFTGTYRDPKEFYEKSIPKFTGVLKIFVEFMLNDIINNPNQTLDECLHRALIRNKIEVTNEEFDELVNNFLSIDAYARCYYRDKIVRELVESGIKIHVFGNGWENFKSKNLENLIIEGGNSYIARKAVADAKISLNIMPWFKAGFQERIATAMLSGSIAVTDGSLYINENFENEKELVIYSLENIEELPAKIKYLLNNPNIAKCIANSGKEKAERELTWQHKTFMMIDFIEKCTKSVVGNSRKNGDILIINYQKKNERMIGLDIIKKLDNILKMIQHIEQHDRIELCDMQYLWRDFLYCYFKIRENFPEISITNCIYDCLMNLEESNLKNGIELFVSECSRIQSIFLKTENRILNVENRMLSTENGEAKEKIKKNEVDSNEILIRKIFRNYEMCTDKDILEILEVIKERKFVAAYNQKFTSEYILSEKNLEAVHYDNNSGMYYVLLNGKKMFYPKSCSKEVVACNFNFINLEQDERSPHRYLDKNFNVEEGDVIIDAGVAEGNFALDVIEKASKVYLIECGHEWVEALEKTFEPWKEKVVIIEKMLGEINDDMHISIDNFVTENEVNFIKMDVEGAEIESLRGASKVLKNSRNIKCAICAYHRKNAEKDIRAIMEEQGFFTTTTAGYMFFKEDMDSWVDGELRRGIVRAVKFVKEDKEEYFIEF